MMKRALLTLLILPAIPFAQDIMLWKATNEDSATLVPAYAGQPSPFPKVVVKTDDVSSTLSAEAEAARLARLQALERAEKLLSGKAAFQPEVGLIHVDGRVEGPAGPKVLITNQWIGVGRQLQVRLSRTAQANTALDELRKYDADAASELDSKLDQRLQQQPFLDLTIDSIKDKQIQLHSTYGVHIIPIYKAQED